MRRLAVAAALMAAACGGEWTFPTAESDPREAHVLAETAHFAARLRVHVRGVVTDEVYVVIGTRGEPVPAAGWYSRGVAYYWRRELLRRDRAWGTALAAHEVCHARFFDHGPAHSACVEELLR